VEELFNKLLDISLWIPPTLVTVLLGIAGWLARNWIMTRLTSSVRHEYDVKLKKVEHNLKTTEVYLKTRLDKKSQQINALRSGALTGITQRQSLLFDKRVNALDVIWHTIVKLRRFSFAASVLMTIDENKAFQAVSEDARYAEPFKMLALNASPEEMTFLQDAHNVRPHVSILVWAYYAAYEAIITKAVTTLHVLHSGLSKKLLADDDKLKSLLVLAIPELVGDGDKFIPALSYSYLEFIEKKLLESIEHDLKGFDIDQAGVDLANRVIESASKLNKE
jgi:hypothetical protein